MTKMRHLKRTAYRAAKRLGLFAMARRATAGSVRILCYHGTWLAEDGFPGDAMFMRAETFERRLASIRRLGHPVIHLQEAVDILRGAAPARHGAVVITIDDGWYSTFRDMLPALRRHGMPATLYCDTGHLSARRPVAHVMARYLRAIGRPEDPATEALFETAADRTAGHDRQMAALREAARRCGVDLDRYLSARCFDYMSPQQLANSAAAGLDVQLHTHSHSMHDLGAGAIGTEIEQNRRALAAILDRDASSFRHFCYPSGVSSPAAARACEAAGTTSATTTVQGLASRGCDLHLVPRLLDGEQLDDIEFEAELSGFADIVRRLRATIAACADRWNFLIRHPVQPNRTAHATSRHDTAL